MVTTNKSNEIINDGIVKDISDAVKGLEFGTILIKVHDSRIIQLEITQKKRFDDIWITGKGGGI